MLLGQIDAMYTEWEELEAQLALAGVYTRGPLEPTAMNANIKEFDRRIHNHLHRSFVFQNPSVSLVKPHH